MQVGMHECEQMPAQLRKWLWSSWRAYGQENWKGNNVRNVSKEVYLLKNSKVKKR